jgi:hypothetical protein
LVTEELRIILNMVAAVANGAGEELADSGTACRAPTVEKAKNQKTKAAALMGGATRSKRKGKSEENDAGRMPFVPRDKPTV